MQLIAFDNAETFLRQLTVPTFTELTGKLKVGIKMKQMALFLQKRVGKINSLTKK